MKQLSLPVKAKIRQSGRQRLAGAAPLPKTTVCLASGFQCKRVNEATECHDPHSASFAIRARLYVMTTSC